MTDETRDGGGGGGAAVTHIRLVARARIFMQYFTFLFYFLPHLPYDQEFLATGGERLVCIALGAAAKISVAKFNPLQHKRRYLLQWNSAPLHSLKRSFPCVEITTFSLRDGVLKAR